MGAVHHHSNRDPQAIDQVSALQNYLRASCCLREEIGEWCHSQGWDYDLLRKAFQRHTGVSPSLYRLRYRLERACTLLHQTREPIAAIAEQLGYTSPYEFSAQFKREHGLTPKPISSRRK